jgi:hypothetical protein
VGKLACEDMDYRHWILGSRSWVLGPCGLAYSPDTQEPSGRASDGGRIDRSRLGGARIDDGRLVKYGSQEQENKISTRCPECVLAHEVLNLWDGRTSH